ncbi:hypothetical protein BH11MYX2_BH11MYX2_38810 [soil metagenome]
MMMESGAARVLAVAIGIGAGLFVPWLRHHGDRDDGGAVYADPPYVAPSAVEVQESNTQRRDRLVDQANNYDDEYRGQVHLDMKLPAFDVYDRDRLGYTLVTGESVVSVQEMSANLARDKWSGLDVAEYASAVGLGIEVERGAVHGRLADGRYPFTSKSEDGALPGWLGAKVCGDAQIVVVAASTSKKELQQITTAFRRAGCSKELLTY